jgi:hypothetical protein
VALRQKKKKIDTPVFVVCFILLPLDFESNLVASKDEAGMVIIQ